LQLLWTKNEGRKLNLFTILDHLYTDTHCQWIDEIEEIDENGKPINPFIIQEWLCLNDSIRTQVRFLDRYTYNLDIQMYLSLAWSIIPKAQKTPRVKWIPKVDSDEEWGFILSKIRKHLNLSDNDYKSLKIFLLKEIKKDMINWFSAYGIERKYYKLYNLNFDKVKEYGPVRVIAQKGLNQWGL